MLSKEIIINQAKEINQYYSTKGFKIFSLFGSFANGKADNFSDVDLTYKIDHNIFYKDDAFKKLNKIEEIKKELESKLKRKVDLIPLNTNNKFIRENLKKEQILI